MKLGADPPLPVLAADWPRPRLAVAPGILLALCSRGRESGSQICRLVPIHARDPRGLGAAGSAPLCPQAPPRPRAGPSPNYRGSGRSHWAAEAGPGSRAPPRSAWSVQGFRHKEFPWGVGFKLPSRPSAAPRQSAALLCSPDSPPHPAPKTRPGKRTDGSAPRSAAG